MGVEMKKFTFLFIILTVSLLSNSYIKAEYGQQNNNRILSGLGISSSYVGIGSQTAFDRTADGTIDLWVYPTNVSGVAKTIISKGAGTNVSFLWSLGTDARMIFRIGTTDFVNSDGSQIPLNNWTHIAVTWGGGTNYTVKFYINGIKSGSDIVNFATWNINIDQIRIGTSQAYPLNIFQGNIDEVRFWGSELSQNRIIANRFIGLGDAPLANSGNAITSSAFYSTLISSWTFNYDGIVAYDYISGYNGTFYGSAFSSLQIIGTPIPYNFALRLGGSVTDNIRIPHSSVFNQTTEGTIEFWFKPVSLSTEQILISKGSALPSSISFILGVVANTGKLYFGIGANVVQNTSGTGLTLNQWNHIAVTWLQSGLTYEIRFYKNGKQNGVPSILSATFPVNTEPIWVGGSAAYVLPAKGWIDELRFWHPVLSESSIQFNMFNSCKAYSDANMIGAWDFDGNLINFSSTTGINATFSNGSVNNCRFSGFTNDTTTGAPGVSFIAHTTVINRTGSPNPYPYGFNSKAPFLTIPDNNATGVSDSILINSSLSNIANIELFLSVEHSWVGDLTISIKAPNGTIKNLIANNGSSGDNVLSFFNDDFPNSLTTAGFYPPWSFVKPLQSFGNFGGSPVNGYWTLKCVDGAGGDIGVLEGWGIRFNNAVSKQNYTAEIPKEFTLYQNYPNPFNPVTNIKFDLPYDSKVNLIVYDVIGKEINKIFDNEFKKAGSHIVEFNAVNIASGVYFYKIAVDAFEGRSNFIDIKKMIIVK